MYFYKLKMYLSQLTNLFVTIDNCIHIQSNMCAEIHYNMHEKYIVICMRNTEMEKRADTADISVLIFLWLC